MRNSFEEHERSEKRESSGDHNREDDDVDRHHHRKHEITNSQKEKHGRFVSSEFRLKLSIEEECSTQGIFDQREKRRLMEFWLTCFWHGHVGSTCNALSHRCARCYPYRRTEGLWVYCIRCVICNMKWVMCECENECVCIHAHLCACKKRKKSG